MLLFAIVETEVPRVWTFRPLPSRAITPLADTVVKTADAGVALKALAKLDVVREDAAPAGPQVMVVLGGSVDPLTGRSLSPVAVPPDPTDS